MYGHTCNRRRVFFTYVLTCMYDECVGARMPTILSVVCVEAQVDARRTYVHIAAIVQVQTLP